MKKIIKFLAVFVFSCIVAASLTACGGNGEAIDNNPENPVTGESKILIAYFSWSGNTQQLAEMIADQTGGERFRIVPETAYTNEDVFDRAQSELNSGTRPPLAEHIDGGVMAEYDVIFIGFPIWWYDLPMPVWTFLEEYDLSGKTIIPFFSHNGSSSGASSISTVRRLCPNSTVESNYLSVRGSSVSGAEEQITDWLNELEMTVK